MLVYKSYNDVSGNPNAKSSTSEFSNVDVFEKEFTSNYASRILTRKVFQVTPKFKFNIDWRQPIGIFNVPNKVFCKFVTDFAREFGGETPFFTFGNDDKKIFTARIGDHPFGVVFTKNYKNNFDLNDRDFLIEINQEIIIDLHWKEGRFISW